MHKNYILENIILSLLQSCASMMRELCGTYQVDLRCQVLLYRILLLPSG